MVRKWRGCWCDVYTGEEEHLPLPQRLLQVYLHLGKENNVLEAVTHQYYIQETACGELRFEVLERL